MDALIADAANRIFADHVDKPLLDRAEAGEFPQRLWQVLCEAGLHLVGARDSGTSLADILVLLKVAGRHAVPLPLAEVWVAGHVLDDAEGGGLAVVADDALVAAWGRRAERVLTLDGRVATEFSVETGTNLAGEPRDRIEVKTASAIDLPEQMPELMATTRAALAAGALERTLELAIEYATTRSQFGRTISRFQAIQHQLAVLAGEVAAAVRACDGAIEALAPQEPLPDGNASCPSPSRPFTPSHFAAEAAKSDRLLGGCAVERRWLLAEVVSGSEPVGQQLRSNCRRARQGALGADSFVHQAAAAKARVGEACGIAAEIAHQVHGAMGFTHEHTLHHFTRRLWSWRDEFGNEAFWQRRLGERLAATGADGLWDFITSEAPPPAEER